MVMIILHQSSFSQDFCTTLQDIAPPVFVYFIALLVVQSILMGATIDYAIVYTSYYIESREKLNVKESVKNAYNKSIHTILTSSSILTVAHNTPCDKVLHSIDTIPLENFPTHTNRTQNRTTSK